MCLLYIITCNVREGVEFFLGFLFVRNKVGSPILIKIHQFHSMELVNNRSLRFLDLPFTRAAGENYFIVYHSGKVKSAREEIFSSRSELQTI